MFPKHFVKSKIFAKHIFLNFIPLTTNAIFLSDLSETSISDSSNFLKNKMFLHEFFSAKGYQDIRNVRFFLFLTVLTYFSSDFNQIFFFLQRATTVYGIFAVKRLFGTYHDLKLVV